MTSTTATHFQATHPDERGASGTRQIGALIRRNLTHIKRQPEMLTDVTIQPVMFVLLFAFVFGGSINIPGVDYKEWLLPGIMAQTMAFSSFVVAIGLNNDLGKGIVDRFRSLPIGRGAVVVARSVSSLIHSSLGIVVMSVTGLFIGWGIHNGLAQGLLGYGLLVLFGFMMIWIGILVGSSLRSVEAVQGVMFVTIFPITFLSNAFARTQYPHHSVVYIRIRATTNYNVETPASDSRGRRRRARLLDWPQWRGAPTRPRRSCFGRCGSRKRTASSISTPPTGDGSGRSRRGSARRSHASAHGSSRSRTSSSCSIRGRGSCRRSPASSFFDRITQRARTPTG